MKKTPLFVSVVVSLVLLFGCAKKTNESQQQSQQQGTSPGAEAIPNSIAGVHWTVPQGWTARPKLQMRAATYEVPSPIQGVEPGDCGVFYFGNGQGGSVNENLNRWISQFESGGKHAFASKEVNNLKVTMIQVSGTYLSPSGPMMESQAKKPNYRLLGAIVESPQGLVFFKLTGPAQTIDASESGFNQLVNSLTKD